MKFLRTHIYHTCIGVFLIGILWIITSCINLDYDEFKNIPDIKFSGHGDITRSSLAYHFGYQRGYNSSNTKIPTNVQIVQLDEKYKPVDYYWFRSFNSWFKDSLFNNGLLSLGNNSSNLDCDNYSMLYKSFMSTAAYKSGATIEPASCLIITRQVYEFGGLPTGGAHMLVMVMTNQGWYVVEPQTGEFDKLEKYPNQEYITTLIF